eukprot:2810281-Rhodomonas_salina.2
MDTAVPARGPYQHAAAAAAQHVVSTRPRLYQPHLVTSPFLRSPSFRIPSARGPPRSSPSARGRMTYGTLDFPRTGCKDKGGRSAPPSRSPCPFALNRRVRGDAW